MSRQRKRHTPEQIVRKIGQLEDRLLGEAKPWLTHAANLVSLSKPIIDSATNTVAKATYDYRL